MMWLLVFFFIRETMLFPWGKEKKEQKWIALTNKCIYHSISKFDQLLGPLQALKFMVLLKHVHQDHLR